ncbi:MAG: alpha/beta hydrolase fold protein, partial [Sphingomonas bacterium]
WMPQMLAAARRDDRAVVDGITTMLARCTPEIFAAQQAAMMSRNDLTPLLAGIRVPTLVATGEEDGWASPAQHEQIAAAIPGATLRIVPGAGHMMPVEDPAAVTAILLEWTARLNA